MPVMMKWLTYQEACKRFNKSESTIRRAIRSSPEKESIVRERIDGKIEISLAWLESQFGMSKAPSSDRQTTEQMQLAVESQKLSFLQQEIEQAREDKKNANKLAIRICTLLSFVFLAVLAALVYLWQSSSDRQMKAHETALNAIEKQATDSIAISEGRAHDRQLEILQLRQENSKLKEELIREQIKPQRRYLVHADNKPIQK